MGRIKTALIKRVTNELMEQHGQMFKSDFDENKRVVDQLIRVSSQRIRNTVAGYATRLKKKQAQ